MSAALLAALLAAGLGGAPPAGGPAPGDLPAAVEALLSEQVDLAAPVLERLAADHPASPDARRALGLLRYFQHRYAEAVELLGGAAGAPDPTGFLRLAVAARDLTGGDAVVESDHFSVALPRGRDEVLAPYLLDALERQRAALVADLGAVPPGKVRVEVLDSVGDLARLSTLTDAQIRTTGTIALCKYAKLMLVSPAALVTGYPWLDTAAHEYTHAVVTARTRDRAPIWLQEGLARWLESRWRGAAGLDLGPVSAALLQRAAASGRLVTFAEMHPSMARLPSQEAAELAFAEVTVAVEEMVARGGPGALGRILDLVAAGVPAERAVADALGTTWGGFEAGWRARMVSRPLPRGGRRALARLRFRDDPRAAGPWAEWAELPDPPSRDHARLGELLRERGRWTAARVEYRRALDRAGPRVALLVLQYAVAATRSGETAGLERLLAEAVVWSPDSAALRVQLARRLLARGDLAGGRAELLAANRQDPLDPEIHAGLAEALAGLGDAGGASRERRFAAILSTREGDR